MSKDLLFGDEVWEGTFGGRSESPMTTPEPLRSEEGDLNTSGSIPSTPGLDLPLCAEISMEEFCELQNLVQPDSLSMLSASLSQSGQHMAFSSPNLHSLSMNEEAFPFREFALPGQGGSAVTSSSLPGAGLLSFSFQNRGGATQCGDDLEFGVSPRPTISSSQRPGVLLQGSVYPAHQLQIKPETTEYRQQIHFDASARTGGSRPGPDASSESTEIIPGSMLNPRALAPSPVAVSGTTRRARPSARATDDNLNFSRVDSPFRMEAASGSSVPSSPSQPAVKRRRADFPPAPPTREEFNSVLKEQFNRAKVAFDKQNCHFCGQIAPMEKRVTCQNPYCSLQGQKIKYICTKCFEYQKEFFGKLDVDWHHILGEPAKPNWFCPACTLWEDGHLPFHGLCCCSFRRRDVCCQIHPEGRSEVSIRAVGGSIKRNFHCKAYKQKITSKKSSNMCDIGLDVRRIRASTTHTAYRSYDTSGLVVSAQSRQVSTAQSRQVSTAQSRQVSTAQYRSIPTLDGGFVSVEPAVGQVVKATTKRTVELSDKPETPSRPKTTLPVESPDSQASTVVLEDLTQLSSQSPQQSENVDGRPAPKLSRTDFDKIRGTESGSGAFTKVFRAHSEPLLSHKTGKVLFKNRSEPSPSMRLLWLASFINSRERNDECT
eukprot:873637_1